MTYRLAIYFMSYEALAKLFRICSHSLDGRGLRGWVKLQYADFMATSPPP
jgi:hypothetical protein